MISISYSWSEEHQCGSVAGADCKALGVNWQGYINRTNIEFMKLGAMGATVVVASGDSGAHGRTDRTCFLNQKMHPNFPVFPSYMKAPYQFYVVQLQ